MSIKMDYYYNQIGNEFIPSLNIHDVINGRQDFVGCFIMRVNDKPVLNDYETYPENKIYTDMDWIAWLGTQFMKSLITFEKKSDSYSYIHFLEYRGGKGLEIHLKSEDTVCINYVSSGIDWFSFDNKKENLEYYWRNEEVLLSEYKEAIYLYCKKIYEEYNCLNQLIMDSLYPEFENNYKYLYL